MNKIELEKNVLDLSYKRNLQLINIILISSLGALFAYIGALILNPEKSLLYTFAIIIICAFIYIFYNKKNEDLKKISERIKSLR